MGLGFLSLLSKEGKPVFSIKNQIQLGEWLCLMSFSTDGTVNSEKEFHGFVCDSLSYQTNSYTISCCGGSNL